MGRDLASPQCHAVMWHAITKLWQLSGCGVEEAGTGTRVQDMWGLSRCVQTWLPCPFLPQLHCHVSITFWMATVESNRGPEAGREAEALQSGAQDSGPRHL